MSATISSNMADLGGANFHYLEAGGGPAILCLHGFPDHAGTWRNLMRHMDRSFHLIAPDQRGYNLSARPEGVGAYSVEHLVGDMIALLDKLGIERTVVCGNDWGGVIAFYLAMRHPDRVSHLVSINSVHPYIFQEFIWDDPKQREASQYFNRFRHPDAAAHFTETRREEMIAAWYGPAKAAGYMSDADIESYRNAWSQTGVWDAMLNWYRASPITVPDVGEPAPQQRWTEGLDFEITQPTLVLWGKDDAVFVPGAASALAKYAERLKIVWLEGEGHTPQRSCAERCAKEITGFLSQYPE